MMTILSELQTQYFISLQNVRDKVDGCFKILLAACGKCIIAKEYLYERWTDTNFPQLLCDEWNLPEHNSTALQVNSSLWEIIHTWSHTQLHNLSHTHTHTRARTRTRTHTHTHTHTHLYFQNWVAITCIILQRLSRPKNLLLRIMYTTHTLAHKHTHTFESPWRQRSLHWLILIPEDSL